MGDPPEGRPVSSEVVYRGPLFSVEVERWANPDRRRDIVRHLGAVAVVPILPDGRIALVRQYREAVRGFLLEVPAGVLDVPGEEPAVAAAREVKEETDLTVRQIRALHPIHTSPGFVDEAIHLFVADVEGEPKPQEAEGITEIVLLSFDDAERMVRTGEIDDAKTALAILLARPAGEGK